MEMYDFGGIDPPCHSLIPPDCPSLPRLCVECGKSHDTGWQDMKTGEMIERFDKCKDCLLSPLLKSFYDNIEKVHIDKLWTEEELKEWNKTN